MMTYLARLSLPRLLKAALIPVLLFTFLAVSSQIPQDQEPDNLSTKSERYEHKMIHPARAHSPLVQYITSMRLVHPENILALQPEPSVPLLCVSFFPVIYIILKRLLLYPLKYTSHFISVRTFCKNLTTRTTYHRLLDLNF